MTNSRREFGIDGRAQHAKDAAKIDFDDDLTYREVARPIARRKLSMKQVPRNEALLAFKAWREKADKIRY